MRGPYEFCCHSFGLLSFLHSGSLLLCFPPWACLPWHSHLLELALPWILLHMLTASSFAYRDHYAHIQCCLVYWILSNVRNIFYRCKNFNFGNTWTFFSSNVFGSYGPTLPTPPRPTSLFNYPTMPSVKKYHVLYV